MTNPGGNTPDTNAERYVKAEILQWLAKCRPDILCWNNPTGKAHFGVDTNSVVRYGLVGSPDIIGIMPNGQFIGIECKRRDGGKQSPEQKAFERASTKRGAIYILARSVEDVKGVIG